MLARWMVRRIGAVLLFACWQAGQAASIATLTPQGEVAQVRQLVVRFDEAVVAFGDLRAADPVTLACDGGTPAGNGRWVDDRSWVHDFRQPLPPGTRCRVTARAGWKPLQGALSGRTTFDFSTGGPAVTGITPGDGSTVEEDQHFLLTLSGPAVEASVAGRAWCEVEGIGERIPLRVVGGAPRDALIRSRHLDKQAARLLLLACQRPLPNDVRLRLVWGAGIAAAVDPRVVSHAAQTFEFTTRKAFSADFSCERERANAPCLPVRPLSLRFSEPVARAVALQARLQPAGGGAPIAPKLDAGDTAAELSEIAFPTPLAENAAFTIELPKDLTDAAGRPLANAASFPLAVTTGAAPPIAKFAAAPFGVVERGADAMLPLTLRHVQGELRPSPAAAPAGQVRVKRLDTPNDVLVWLGRVRRYHESQLSARDAGLPASQWTELVPDTDSRGRSVMRRQERFVGTRELSLLKNEPGARRLDLPALQGGDPRPFEVVGIPLGEPGYHVVEIESRRLGESLLDKPAPLYVRTGVLVTNLGVHFKLGRENSLAWVTTLDRGAPVAGAEVTVHDCRGHALWSGSTDAAGLARIPRAFEVDDRHCVAEPGLFVTARLADPRGVVDQSFVFSSWQQGIEAWRFNLPTAGGSTPELRAHTVFDRTLLRAGETVSMKHFVRVETSGGLAAVPADALPTTLKIVHDGSGQQFTLPLQWNGTRHALSSWTIPPAAKLGVYRVVLQRDGGSDRRGHHEWTSGDFRVEAFRVPLVDARLIPPKAAPVAPQALALDVQMNYLSGGAMAGAPLRATALLRPRDVAFAGFEDFSFEPPRAAGAAADAEPDADDGAQRPPDGQLVADKRPLATDANGAAKWTLKGLPALARPSELLAEVSFNDPNGEVQTVSSRLPLWPSAVLLGLRTAGWASSGGQAHLSVVALDTAGRPINGQAVAVKARLSQVVSTRKRIVGGLYAYDNRTDVKDLGVVCSGRTDDRGLLACDARLDAAGQVELVAEAKDGAGHLAQAAASVWVTRQGELWFAQDNDDRIDVLPEKRRYEPGETARLQVRMPFREASVLLAVEREGIVETRVLTLRGSDPTIALKIEPHWAPNVYVSVLAVRGRVRHVPWYSFFDWGWKEPLNWGRAFWYEGRAYQAPTAMVDLSKPAFKFGVAALKVGSAAHELQVAVTADKPQYLIRQKALARVRVTQNGKPAAGAEVAFAAVDEGLLALRPNTSWDLPAAMVRERGWGVETSTAQNEIVGRRHYGRKAVAAGGGGGRGGGRELFDTLLLWKAVVPLDANGEATVEVPLNDSLTSFRLVAVADAGQQTFGSGAATIRVTQDLQLLSGLPPLVREGDRFVALLTLRNTTGREMKLRATLAGTVGGPATAGGTSAAGTAVPAGAGASAAAPAGTLALPPQDVVLAAGGAREVAWPVDVPADASTIAWDAAVQETGNGGAAKDRLKFTQQVESAVPVRVLQSTLQQLAGNLSLPVAAPADALPLQGPKRGGLAIGLQPKLSGALPGIRRFFENYPFACLEQQVSKAIGLHDAVTWTAVANALPTYLDSDGLANYFPPRAEDGAHGSDRLTAHVLAAAHEAGFALPPAAQEAMLGGLSAFVQGRIERKSWSPDSARGLDLDVRKLAAIEALSRYRRADPKLLGSINLTPRLWPTAALIDWLRILRRIDPASGGIADQAQRLAEAQQILRSRLTFAGSTLTFSTEGDDFWWWLMDSADANAARLILAVLDDPAWRDELPRLVVGSLGRQKRGAWLTTTANLWGALALDKFSARFEADKVTGRTVARVGTAGGSGSGSGAGIGRGVAGANAVAGAGTASLDWAASPDGGRLQLPWPAATGTLTVDQAGGGKPWLTVQSLAAIPLTAPLRAGYAVTRTVSAVAQKTPGGWSRGDVLRVRLEIDAQSDMTWVVVSDPVPGGATLLGSGLGRDSAIASRGERREGAAWPAYEERGFAAFRSYFESLPRGRHVVEYTLRLNNPGRFTLPPTRVEAMYAPETFGELPNAGVDVAP